MTDGQKQIAKYSLYARIGLWIGIVLVIIGAAIDVTSVAETDKSSIGGALMMFAGSASLVVAFFFWIEKKDYEDLASDQD